MKKIFIICLVFCCPFALWADEVDLERLLFDCTKPGDNTSCLRNIDGDILITYPKGNCKLHNNLTLAIVSLLGRQYLYDYKGEICSYETIQGPEFYLEGLYIVSNSKKYGIIDVSGNIIVPIIYDDIEIRFDNNLMPRAAVRKDGKTGLLEIESNSLIIPFNYDSIGENFRIVTASGHYLVRKNGKFGLINANLHNITPFKYDYIGVGPEEEYGVYINDNWQSLHLTRIKLNDKWGILNTVSGEEVLPCIYDKISSWQFTSDLFLCKKGDKWGCVNHQNNVIIPFQFLSNEHHLYVNHDYPEFMFNADIIGKNENEVLIFNSKGKLRMNGIEELYFQRYYKNIYIIRKDNKWRMVDSKSFKDICVFDNVSSWDRSDYYRYLVSINTDGSRSLWDIETKKKLIESVAYINVYYDKYATGRYRGGSSFIMNLGTSKTTILSDVYNLFYSDQLFVVQETGNESKSGVIDSVGNLIIPIEYDSFFTRADGLYTGARTIEIKEKLILVKETGIFSRSGKLLLRGDFISMDPIEEISYYDLSTKPLYKFLQEYHKLLQGGSQLFEISRYDKYNKKVLYGYYTYDGEKLNELFLVYMI